MRKIFKNKEVLITSLIVFATLFQFFHDSLQGDIENLKDVVFDRSIAVVSGAAALAANSADILLQRDLLEVCKANDLNLCGSSELLLKEDVLVRDKIRSFAYEAPEHLQTALKDYEKRVDENRWPLLFTSLFFYIFLGSVIFINLFIKSDMKNIKSEAPTSNQKDSLYIKGLLWAYDKGHRGFTTDQMKKELDISEEKWPWVHWMFFNGLNGAAPLIWIISSEFASDGVTHHDRFYLSAAGMTATVDYLELKEAQKSGRVAMIIAIISIIIGVIVGLGQIYVQATDYHYFSPVSTTLAATTTAELDQ